MPFSLSLFLFLSFTDRIPDERTRGARAGQKKNETKKKTKKKKSTAS